MRWRIVISQPQADLLTLAQKTPVCKSSGISNLQSCQIFIFVFLPWSLANDTKRDRRMSGFLPLTFLTFW